MELQVNFRSNGVSELIKTSQNEQGEVIINGRELHEFLEVNSNYTTWFNRMTEYGFIDGEDFIPILEESTGGRPSYTHAVKIDMAKQIAMIQRSDKGKEAREYFLKVESLWNSPEKVMERALQFAKQRVEEASVKIFSLETKVEKLTHSGKLYTADELGKELGLSSIKLNKLLHAQGFQYKRNNTWVPYAKYADKNLVSIKQGEYNNKIVYDRKFTEQGRQFVLDLLEVK